MEVVADVDRGLFGLDEEFAHPADTKAIVGRLGASADLDGVLVYDVLVGFGIPLLVVDVPAQQLEKWIDKLAAGLGFVVVALPVGGKIVVETLDQLVQFGGWGQKRLALTRFGCLGGVLTCLSRRQLSNRLQLLADSCLSCLQVVSRLKIEPVLRRLA